VASGEREVLALLLRTNAAAVAEVLVGSEQGQAYSALAALTAAKSLGRTVDDVLHALVRQARSEGTTWQQVGDALGTTRQNAYQRFGGAEPAHEQEPPMQTGLASADALEVLHAWAAGDLERVTRDFDATMRERLTGDLLAASWRQITEAVGPLVSYGEPAERTIGGHVVIDVPATFERDELKGRVAYNADGTVGGLFLLNPAVA
jgi:hypothetical protein